MNYRAGVGAGSGNQLPGGSGVVGQGLRFLGGSGGVEHGVRFPGGSGGVGHGVRFPGGSGGVGYGSRFPSGSRCVALGGSPSFPIIGSAGRWAATTGGRSTAKRPNLASHRSPAFNAQAPPDPIKEPQLENTYNFRVYLFRKRNKNVVPPPKSKNEHQLELELMEHMGLIRLIEFDKLTQDHIMQSISQLFVDRLQGRPWTLLSRTEKGKKKGYWLYAANVVDHRAWEKQEMISETEVGDVYRHIFIAMNDGVITVARDIAETFAEARGMTVEELPLENIEEAVQRENNRRDDQQASTSGLRSTARADDEGDFSSFGGRGSHGFTVGKRRNTVVDLDTPPSSPERDHRPVRFAGVRIPAKGPRNRSEIVTLNFSDDSDVEPLETPSVKEILPLLSTKDDAESSDPTLKKRFAIRDLPEPENQYLTVKDMREQFSVKMTHEYPMVKSQFVYAWLPEKNVENFSNFYCAHGDDLANTGRFQVRMDGAVDADGPYKEFGSRYWQDARYYKFPDINEPLFVEINLVVLYTHVPIVTEEGRAVLRASGFMLREAVMRGASYPDWLSSSVLRSMLGLPLELNEVFHFDKGVGDMIERILSGSGDLTMRQEPMLKQWAENNPTFPCRELMKNSRETFCQYIAEYELVGKRVGNLRYVYEGFLAGGFIKELKTLLPNWKIMEDALYNSVLMGNDLLEQFIAVDYDEASADEVVLAAWLDDIIKDDLSCSDRRKLLRFITGSHSVPASPKIQILFSNDGRFLRRPTAGTCNNTLLLPLACPSKEKLLELIRECLDTMDHPLQGSFQLG
ncbi:uncharacterized protein LOC129598350 isoform X2 [Paramacrobiotus metropolitanus]|nr:uncharacterized protein LOC129598350 isoform X2 [Paramacrobiotus metropolitanus]XP_055352245.1 uncharacterized protein LOC129598350 isoform X2 [Paramacrobiotus metropolitanus]